MSAQADPASEETASGGEACHYDSYYYRHCCGSPYGHTPDWLALFANVASRIVAEAAPESVLDAGCAMGLLVEALADRGVDAHGIDISDYAIAQVDPRVRDRCHVGSVLEPFGRRYDLIVCIEVLEHLSPPDAERAVENFCNHADDVLFSSTPLDFKEASHYNVRPPEYWTELFARHGLYRDLDFDAAFITPWAGRFRRSKSPASRIAAGYERHLWRTSQESRAVRESLVEHQAQLSQSEARREQLERERVVLDAEVAARLASEQAINAHLGEVMTLLHHTNLATAARAVEVEHLLSENDRKLRESLSREREAGERLLAAELRIEEANARNQRLAAELNAARIALESVAHSRAYRLAGRLSRLRASILPSRWRHDPATPSTALRSSRTAQESTHKV